MKPLMQVHAAAAVQLRATCENDFFPLHLENVNTELSTYRLNKACFLAVLNNAHPYSD